jgi:hypothetical protein
VRMNSTRATSRHESVTDSDNKPLCAKSRRSISGMTLMRGWLPFAVEIADDDAALRLKRESANGNK